MKKKLLIILAILCLVITGCGKKESKPNTDQTNNDNEIEQLETKPDFYDEDLFTKLTEYGESIYRTEGYTKYAKRNDIYFASLEDLKNEYDVSIFVGDDGTVCNQTDSGIYFDIDKKLGIDYGTSDPISAVLIGCTKEYAELTSDSHTDELFAKLNEYGDSIYVAKAYTKYKKKNGVYFASLEDLKGEYDVSIFVGNDGTVCNQTDSGIYFDIDKKLGINYGTRNPISVVLIGCTQEQLNSEQ